jgi:hypothetical protein
MRLWTTTLLRLLPNGRDSDSYSKNYSEIPQSAGPTAMAQRRESSRALT